MVRARWFCAIYAAGKNTGQPSRRWGTAAHVWAPPCGQEHNGEMSGFQAILEAVAVSDPATRRAAEAAFANPPAAAPLLTSAQYDTVLETIKQHCSPGTHRSVDGAVRSLIRAVRPRRRLNTRGLLLPPPEP